MSLKVYYTQPAKETLLVLYSSVQSRFGKRSADKFLLKVEKTVDLISEFPLMFKSSSYWVNNQAIFGVLSHNRRIYNSFVFLDTRQEPFFTYLPE
jgi:plasmid stabilization system protein ParE